MVKTTSTICVHRSTRAAFFSSTHLCTLTKEHLEIASLHKMYPRVFFEQEVLRVLTELNVVEMAHIACACITTRDFNSSSNRAVPYVVDPYFLFKFLIFYYSSVYIYIYIYHVLFSSYSRSNMAKRHFRKIDHKCQIFFVTLPQAQYAYNVWQVIKFNKQLHCVDPQLVSCKHLSIVLLT